MAYNEKLADMTRELISQSHNNVEEKAMFGGTDHKKETGILEQACIRVQ